MISYLLLFVLFCSSNMYLQKSNKQDRTWTYAMKKLSWWAKDAASPKILWTTYDIFIAMHSGIPLRGQWTGVEGVALPVGNRERSPPKATFDNESMMKHSRHACTWLPQASTIRMPAYDLTDYFWHGLGLWSISYGYRCWILVTMSFDQLKVWRHCNSLPT